MDNSMPILLIPGLVSSSRIYAPVMPALWRCGPVTVANHIRDDNMGAIARRILAEARPDTSEATERRRGMMARAKSGGYREVLDELFPGFVHPSRRDDESLRQL